MVATSLPWHPLRFRPRYQERVWGGRTLETLYGRELPEGRRIGESWEIVDRPEASSVVAEGALAGRTLGDLMTADPEGLLGDATSRRGRFPLLVKILDARDVLSLQVHPPEAKARELGGESKTEVWYFTRAEPGAEILAGLRRGTTRDEFERRLADGSVASCFHRATVRAGDAMLLPSGRVHALGAGLVLFEIQENSDTTYRVFDWNRPGLDGRPRELHVKESLASTDFDDFEPELVPASWLENRGARVRELARAESFRAWAEKAPEGWRRTDALARCRVIGVVHGALEVGRGPGALKLGPGDFCLVPRASGNLEMTCRRDSEWIAAEPSPRVEGAPGSSLPTLP